MEPDCICANAAMCRTKKLMYFYRSNCDVQANISVAIARIVTDKEIRVLLSQKLWLTKVAISTSVTDWVLLSLLLGRKIMYKCCYRYTVTDTSRRLRDGPPNKTSYCSTYFFVVICYRHFMVSCSQLFRKKAQKCCNCSLFECTTVISM